jgi:mRNA interferase HigB
LVLGSIHLSTDRHHWFRHHLDAWFAEAEKAAWKNSAELKQQFRSASIVSAERVVFNIKGNE